MVDRLRGLRSKVGLREDDVSDVHTNNDYDETESIAYSISILSPSLKHQNYNYGSTNSSSKMMSDWEEGRLHLLDNEDDTHAESLKGAKNSSVFDFLFASH